MCKQNILLEEKKQLTEGNHLNVCSESVIECQAGLEHLM